MINLDMTTLILLIGVLVFLTNAIVEVFKMTLGVTGEKNLNRIALVVAIVLTVASYFIYAAYTGTSIIWYYVIGALILGFIVALVAMVGWDKVLKLYTESTKGSEIK